jgi:SAM-dependent methyltransferase
MATTRASGTEGYAGWVDKMFAQSITFADVQEAFLHLIPTTPSRILDIGSGTGRDAAALAAMGHRVVAIEPTAELLTRAMAQHTSPLIEWRDDSLPELASFHAEDEGFDLVMLTAVWMHLDEAQRRIAMPRVAGLMRGSGTMILTLRHGPVPPGRRMFEVTADETIALAAAEALDVTSRLENQPSILQQPGVTWTRLAFTKTPVSAAPPA